MEGSYIKTVASMVIPYEEGFIYVKTAKDGKWGFSGGKLDLFEEINTGLAREVFEETGFEVLAEYFLGVWDFKSDRGSSVSNRVFSGRIVEGKMNISRLDEILEIKKLSLSEIRDLYRKGELRGGMANLEPVEEYLRGVRYPISIVHTSFVR